MLGREVPLNERGNAAPTKSAWDTVSNRDITVFSLWLGCSIGSYVPLFTPALMNETKSPAVTLLQIGKT